MRVKTVLEEPAFSVSLMEAVPGKLSPSRKASASTTVDTSEPYSRLSHLLVSIDATRHAQGFIYSLVYPSIDLALSESSTNREIFHTFMVKTLKSQRRVM